MNKSLLFARIPFGPHGTPLPGGEYHSSHRKKTRRIAKKLVASQKNSSHRKKNNVASQKNYAA